MIIRVHRMLLLTALALGIAISFGGASAAHAQTAWIGNSGQSWLTAGNWSPANVPDSSGETALFNGSGVGGTAVVVFGGSVATSTGVGGITVNSTQLSAVSINASAGSLTFGLTRTAPGTGVTINGGAPAFSMGTSGSGFMLVPRSGTAGDDVIFTNNSGSTATLGSLINDIEGGSDADFGLRFQGSGNWQVNAFITPDNNDADATVTVSGTGTTTISNSANSYTGGTSIGIGQGPGTLRAAANQTLGSGTVKIGPSGNASTARLELVGSISLNNSIDLHQRNVSDVSIQSISGNNVLSGTIDILSGGGQARIQSDAGLLTLSNATAITGGSTGTRTATLQGAGNGLVSGAITDGVATIRLAKEGSGTWTLSGANTYTGTTTISEGILQIGNGVSSTAGTLGNNSNTSIAAGAVLSINRYFLSGTTSASNAYDYAGQLSGSGTVQVGVDRRFDFAANQTNSGNLAFEVDGILAIRTAAAPSVSVIHLGELSGSGRVSRGGVAGGAATLFIGGKNTSSTFSGDILSPELSVEKDGSGTLVLSGTNTYGGTTTVTDGELIVNGTHTGGGLYTVASGARLGGDGTIGANVLVASTPGQLSPGDAGSPSSYDGSFSYSAGQQFATVGTLNVAGDVDLGGSLLLDLRNDGQDRLNVLGIFELLNGPPNNARLEINGTTDLTTIDFWNILGWTTAGQSLDLVTFDGFGGGTFVNVAFNEYFDDASGRQVMLGLDGNSIFVASTPEPESVALWILIGLLASVVAGRQVGLRRALVFIRKDR